MATLPHYKHQRKLYIVNLFALCVMCYYHYSGPAKLLAYDKVVTFALHLLYEDMKLNILYNSHLEDMAALLHHITRYAV